MTKVYQQSGNHVHQFASLIKTQTPDGALTPQHFSINNYHKYPGYLVR